MNRLTLSWIPVSLVAALTTGCTQPDINCTSAYGPYAAKYTLTQGDPDSTCAQLEGDVLGMRTYYQPGGPNGTPNYQDAKVAIRPESLGLLIEYAAARGAVDADEVYHDANALGRFTAGFPDDEGFCRVEEFSPAEVSLPEIAALEDDPTTPEVDESQPAQAATDIEYRWSDARFVVTADAQGTQFEAELEVQSDGCTASYHVVGVYPAVACETDEDCDDEQNRINPDFAVRCDAALKLCVLADELPAYE